MIRSLYCILPQLSPWMGTVPATGTHENTFLIAAGADEDGESEGGEGDQISLTHSLLNKLRTPRCVYVCVLEGRRRKEGVKLPPSCCLSVPVLSFLLLARYLHLGQTKLQLAVAGPIHELRP